MITHNRAPIFTFRLLFTVVLVSAFVVGQQTPTNPRPHNDEFVKRDGTRLPLGGETFRFGGTNIEWLGVEAHGPLDSNCCGRTPSRSLAFSWLRMPFH